MEELDVRLGFHHEICLLLAALGQKRDVTVDDIYLFPFISDQLGTIEYGEGANHRTSCYRRKDGHQCQPGLLF